MLARFCTGSEGPLGYDYAFIFDLYSWNGFHVYNRLRSSPLSLTDWPASTVHERSFVRSG
jgi:hypothetical protein